MKKLVVNIIAAFITYGAIATNSPANIGIMQLDLTATTGPVGPGLFNQISKTNKTANSTNIVTMGKGKLSQTPFGATNLLALLANSYNTNFPAGSQIGIQLGEGFPSLSVVDASGTNVIFSPFPVLKLSGSAVLYSGLTVDTTVEDMSGTTQSAYATVNITWVATLSYDDTSLTTADGTHTQFAFTGEFFQHNTRPKSKPFVTVSGQMQGAAGGPIRDVQTILTGTIRVKPYQAVPAS